MTIQRLNAYLTERLAVVVREILEVVEDTVSEYREETDRTRSENESLKRQLQDVLLVDETDLLDPVGHASLSVSEGSPAGQQVWSSGLGQEPVAAQQNLGLTESSWSEEKPFRPCSVLLHKIEPDPSLQCPGAGSSVQVLTKPEVANVKVTTREPAVQTGPGYIHISGLTESTWRRQNKTEADPEMGSSVGVQIKTETRGGVGDEHPQKCYKKSRTGMDDLSYLSWECSEHSEESNASTMIEDEIAEPSTAPASTITSRQKSRNVKPSVEIRGSVHTKKHYCLYCRKPVSKIARHLQQVHSSEPEVAQAFSWEKNSDERHKLLNLLRSRGDFAHNTEVAKSGKGILVPRKRIKADSGLRDEDFVHCSYCHGLYQRKSMWRHLQRCPQKCEEDQAAGTSHSWSQLTADPESVDYAIPEGISGLIGSNGVLTALTNNDVAAAPDLDQSVSTMLKRKRGRVSRGRKCVHDNGAQGKSPCACTQTLCLEGMDYSSDSSERSSTTTGGQTAEPPGAQTSTITSQPSSVEPSDGVEIRGSVHTKKHYCLYCRKPVSKIARHLQQVHSSEPEVAQAFSWEKNSEERHKLLNLLRSRGDFAHNTEVAKSGVGSMVPCRRPVGLQAKDKEFAHCLYCQGLYVKEGLWKHKLRCKQNPWSDLSFSQSTADDEN